MAALTETLRSELAPFNIHLKEIFPGPVATPFRGEAFSIIRPLQPITRLTRLWRRVRGKTRSRPIWTIYSTTEVVPAMVDHILDPDGAMRDGTCAMSRQGLENWLPGRGGEPLIAGVVQSMLDGPR